MSFIQDLFGKIFNRKGDQQEGGNFPVSQMTGKRLNPLYQPKLKKRDFDKADKELDDWMTAQGYRKYLHGDRLPRPKRRFLKKSEKLEVGDSKIMAGVSRFKK